MSTFNKYLGDLPKLEKEALEHVIELVRENVPEAEEGLSYGLPAFKYSGRPLLGFSSNKHGLNIYPFDPNIISAVKPELDGYDVSKGVIRFTVENPVPDEIIILMLDLRIKSLQKTT